MITSTARGRADTELCCETCGAHGMWQPLDRNACEDDWWCNRCRAWSEPVSCGPNAMMTLVRRQLVPACPPLKPSQIIGRPNELW